MDPPRMRIRTFVSTLCFGLVAQCFLHPLVFAAEPVRVYDTHGSTDPAQWTQITGTPSNLSPFNTVLENGIIRLTYPPDRAYKPNFEHDSRGSHVLYLKRGDHYTLASDPAFGDWVYVGVGIDTDCTAFRITKNTDEVVEFQMDFNQHRFGVRQPRVPCKVRKTVSLHRGHYGYVVHIDLERSDLRGEKECGFGMSLSHRFFYNHITGHKRPDNEAVTVYLRNPGDVGEWWGAGLPVDDSFYRLLVVRPAYPGAIRTAQWSKDRWGYFYQWVYEGQSAYEVYIAVVPYDGRQAEAVKVEGDTATVMVPRAGKYTLFSRGENAIYTPVVKEIALTAGRNQIPLAGVRVHAPIVAPIANGVDFPEDIAAMYHRLYETEP